jgi:hypothetical protein
VLVRTMEYHALTMIRLHPCTRHDQHVVREDTHAERCVSHGRERLFERVLRVRQHGRRERLRMKVKRKRRQHGAGRKCSARVDVRAVLGAEPGQQACGISAGCDGPRRGAHLSVSRSGRDRGTGAGCSSPENSHCVTRQLTWVACTKKYPAPIAKSRERPSCRNSSSETNHRAIRRPSHAGSAHTSPTSASGYGGGTTAMFKCTAMQREYSLRYVAISDP